MIQAMPATAANSIISGSRMNRRPDVVERHRGGGDAAQDHLAFDAEIPEAHAKRERRADADENQRRRLKQDRVQILRVAEILDDELVEQGRRLHPGDDQQGRRNAEADRERAGKDQRLQPWRHVLPQLEIEPPEPPAMTGRLDQRRRQRWLATGAVCSSMMHHDAADGLAIGRRREFGGDAAAGHDADAIGEIEHSRRGRR